MKIKARKIKREDIEARVNWINDNRINSTMFFDLPASVEKTKTWFLSIQNNNSRIDFSFVNKKMKLVAMGGFTAISCEHQNAEFYIMVNPDMHSQGIGKQVSFWMYNYAFSVLNLHKIFLYTNDDNVSGYSIYEKAGFQLEGIHREHKWKNGKFQNRRFYGLLRKEWLTKDWKKEIRDEL